MIRIAAGLAGFLAAAVWVLPATAQNAAGEPGDRDGPFVLTDKTLGDLVSDGYEVKANIGNYLVLQKEASVFSCGLRPAPQSLSYEPYFVCAELAEQGRLETGDAR